MSVRHSCELTEASYAGRLCAEFAVKSSFGHCPLDLAVFFNSTLVIIF